MKNISETDRSISKKCLFITLTLILAVILSLIIGEILLRIIPIPGIEFDIWTYDDTTGARYFSNSSLIYRNARGDYVKRNTNRWGILDQEHQKEKKEGIYRIAFFGDSFTEARQVPLEQTFYRLIEDSLKSDNIESLGFGMSGFSTLQSYLNSNRFSDFFDLDLVVYVFYGNDPGEQMKELTKPSNRPYPILTENGFQIDYTYRKRNKYKEKLYYKIGDYLTSHSLILSTIVSRIHLLRKYGIEIKASKENAVRKERTHSIPNVGDLPSTWPESLRLKAQELCSTVILQWKNKITSEHRNFAILYIPRADTFKKNIEIRNSWKPWLESLCEKHSITFIDSTINIAEMEFSGKEVFYDHLTRDGHEAVAKAFIDWFVENSVNLKN